MAGLVEKVAGRVRAVCSPELRRIAAEESARARAPRRAGVVVSEVERDAAAGLKRIEVGGASYWQPASMDVGALAAIHAEVFDPDDPHHYEYGGCRIRPGDVVVDAGASEGFFTRFALDRGARVIAIEPWSVQAAALSRTYAAEVADGRVKVVVAALSDREGEVVLEVDPAAPWGATVGHAYKATVRESVPETTLDALVAKTWGRCDFLKADIEGMEHRMALGARATIARDAPRLSIAVYHGPTNYLDVRADILAARPGYVVTGKGQFRHRFVSVPMLLHAWVE